MKKKRIGKKCRILFLILATVMIFQTGNISVEAQNLVKEGLSENDSSDERNVIEYDSFSNKRVDTSWESEQDGIWNIIDTYADTEYFLRDADKEIFENMTDAEYQELRSAAQAAIADANAKTQYEKIVALTMFVADWLYYDIDRQYGSKAPYFLYQTKRTVCSGYSNLLKTLCISVGIPCMTLHQPNHASNAAYDSEQKRWIPIDATLCSNNRYDGGKWTKKSADKKGIGVCGGTILKVQGLLDRKYNSVYYTLKTSGNSWRLSISGAKAKKIKAVAEIEGVPVYEVENSAMSYNKVSVQSVDLSETRIKKIDINAFFDCNKLTELLLPSTLIEIEGQAFCRCRSLEKVELPSSVKIIREHAFYQCDKLKEVDLSNTKISSIGSWAFAECPSLKTIKLPDTIKDIGGFTFGLLGNRRSKVKTTVITNLPTKRLGLKKNVWTNRKAKVIGAYTIHFDGNGADTGTMQNALCGVGMKVRLPTNRFKRSGYQFLGWSKHKSGKGKIYRNKAQIKNLVKKKKTVRLYACWEQI